MSLIKKRYLGTLLKSESRIGRTRLAAIRWQNVGLAKKRKQTGEKCLLKQGSNFKCDYFNLTPHIRKVPRRRVFRGHPYMTSAKFWDFLTPSPLVRIWD